MEHAEIVQKVRDILNEHGGDDGLSIGTDRVLLDEYIESAIPDAVIMLAQKGYAVNKKQIRVSDPGDEIAAGEFVSFIGATSIKWNKKVTKLTAMDSPEFLMSQNPFTKPGPNTPIVWWDELYGDLRATPWEDDVLVQFTFNKKYIAGEGINAEPKEATAVCYMTAALVLGMFGDDQGKQRLSDIATNMLQ
jgi:hypothetical protein